MCSDAGSELAPIMVLHERQRSLPSEGHVSPPKLEFSVQSSAHSLASVVLPKFCGLPGKSE